MSLFGEDELPAVPARTRKRKAAAAVPDPACVRCEALFLELFQKKWRCAAQWNHGRNRKRFNELLATWSEPDVAAIVADFFATRDPQITRTDYSADVFFRKAQYLMISRQGQVEQQLRRDSRTADNVDAALRATRSHNK